MEIGLGLVAFPVGEPHVVNPPSEYRELMPGHVEPVLHSALIPSNLFNDDYDDFIGIRSELLADEVSRLTGVPRPDA